MGGILRRNFRPRRYAAVRRATSTRTGPRKSGVIPDEREARRSGTYPVRVRTPAFPRMEVGPGSAGLRPLAGMTPDWGILTHPRHRRYTSNPGDRKSTRLNSSH